MFVERMQNFCRKVIRGVWNDAPKKILGVLESVIVLMVRIRME